MKTKPEEIVDEFLVETEYLWNTSGLNDDVIQAGIRALHGFEKKIKEDLDLERCPKWLARKMGYTLVLYTVEMILSLYPDD